MHITVSKVSLLRRSIGNAYICIRFECSTSIIFLRLESMMPLLLCLNLGLLA